ncbi:MAG: DUF4238 domain-containing protein, partial [Roseibium sp.]|uniref:DUF4238 domain-containing protein n=1 Tax=Roseibium sp. TaxID=1936156 RepID=UPI003297FD8D
MSKTRNNHYVPQWYQEGFFEPDQNTLAYLDMTPMQHVLADGTSIPGRAKFVSPTTRCFRERDLYSTFFGTTVNDEIERKLFGSIDTRGSKAIRAFVGDDPAEWHRHFETLFEFIDIQKIRTPKGLDWLRAQYPSLSQNELMYELQGIRMMHCTIWTEGIREIVSAEDADVKFIVTDHPVTIYNHAAPPNDSPYIYPNDPGIALKGSQTIFPLNRDFCLILTNLEYGQDPDTNPLEKRTFARNYRQSMVRTDAFIRSRKLSDLEVANVNRILKARARRYVAAGREEWLYPEEQTSGRWDELRDTLLPKDELWRFGGELYAKYDDGHVHYQDAFGRTEKPRDFLLKTPPKKEPRPGDACGCGSGKRYRECCKSKPLSSRPTWTERSIRERNLMLYRAVVGILELDKGKDWTAVRRDLTDEQISKIYHLHEGLWPLETDLLQLLPKPDGTPRAVYTGSIHPESITEFALGASLHFGELLVESPFLHAGAVRKEYSPVENPRAYRQEFLKTVLFFLTVMPLVEVGLINLIPDPCNFDPHLRYQMMHMAKERSASSDPDLAKEGRLKELMEQDFQRNIMALPEEALEAQLRKAFPDISKVDLNDALRGFEQLREHDPLAILQADTFAGGKEGGQLSMMKLAPNFEMAMYLAQATGSSIVTDSRHRWEEIMGAVRLRGQGEQFHLTKFWQRLGASEFLFPFEPEAIVELFVENALADYPPLFCKTLKYLASVQSRGPKPNVEAHLAGRFDTIHSKSQAALKKTGYGASIARMTGLFPANGIQDNTVNRLLLMSSSEDHLPHVPMAFFIEA